MLSTLRSATVGAFLLFGGLLNCLSAQESEGVAPNRGSAGLTLTCGPSLHLGVNPSTRANVLVSSVNGRSITEEKLLDLIQPQLRDLEDRVYQLRDAALEILIARELIAQEARSRQLSPEEFLRGRIGRITIDAMEVERSFEASRQNLTLLSQFEAKERIRHKLAIEETRRAYTELVTELRKKANVKVYLPNTRMNEVPVGSSDPSPGPLDAEVTIVEFLDFECPFCKQAQEPLNLILAEEPSSVRLVVKHLPLPNHPTARQAALASLCAHDQKRFWEYHDQLFSESSPFFQARLTELAERIGLDRQLFVACMQDGRHADVLAEHRGIAEQASIKGTPSFVVNGRVIRGAVSYEQLRRIIRESSRTDKTPNVEEGIQ